MGNKRQTKAQMLATMFALLQEGKTQDEIIAQMGTAASEKFTPEQIEAKITERMQSPKFIELKQKRDAARANLAKKIAEFAPLYTQLQELENAETQEFYNTIPSGMVKKIKVMGKTFSVNGENCLGQATLAYNAIKRAERQARTVGENGEAIRYAGYTAIASFDDSTIANHDKMIKGTTITRKAMARKIWDIAVVRQPAKPDDGFTMTELGKILIDAGATSTPRKTFKMVGDGHEWFAPLFVGVKSKK